MICCMKHSHPWAHIQGARTWENDRTNKESNLHTFSNKVCENAATGTWTWMLAWAGTNDFLPKVVQLHWCRESCFKPLPGYTPMPVDISLVSTCQNCCLRKPISFTVPLQEQNKQDLDHMWHCASVAKAWFSQLSSVLGFSPATSM